MANEIRGGSAAHSKAVHAGFGVLVAVAIVAWATGDVAIRLGAVALIGSVPAVTIGFGLRLNRVTNRGTWYTLLAATVLFTAFNYLWFVDLGLGWDVAADGVANVALQVVAYLCILWAALQVVRKHGEADRGGVIDAALIAVGLITPVWEFLLRPHLLDIESPTATQALYLLKMLLLMATLGALLRIARTAGTARTALTYFFISMTATVISVIVSLLSTRPGSDYYSPLVDLLAMIGYAGLAAAGMHPSSKQFTQPDGWRRRRLRPVKLAHLGAVLALVPVVGSAPQLFGATADALLLSLGTLLVIPLVIMRIGQLMEERTADQEALRYQAHHDELTGLINRRRFFTLLAEAVEQHRTGSLPGLAVLYCDLDRFKAVNDQYGHEAGDRVLQAFAERLRSTLRTGDIAARVGGDEFLVLCRGAAAPDADALRRRIEEATVAPVDWAEHRFHFGVTVGVAVSAGPATEADELMSDADADMYRRKAARRTRPEPAPSLR